MDEIEPANPAAEERTGTKPEPHAVENGATDGERSCDENLDDKIGPSIADDDEGDLLDGVQDNDMDAVDEGSDADSAAEELDKGDAEPGAKRRKGADSRPLPAGPATTPPPKDLNVTACAVHAHVARWLDLEFLSSKLSDSSLATDVPCAALNFRVSRPELLSASNGGDGAEDGDCAQGGKKKGKHKGKHKGKAKQRARALFDTAQLSEDATVPARLYAHGYLVLELGPRLAAFASSGKAFRGAEHVARILRHMHALPLNWQAKPRVEQSVSASAGFALDVVRLWDILPRLQRAARRPRRGGRDGDDDASAPLSTTWRCDEPVVQATVGADGCVVIEHAPSVAAASKALAVLWKYVARCEPGYAKQERARNVEAREAKRKSRLEAAEAGDAKVEV